MKETDTSGRTRYISMVRSKRDKYIVREAKCLSFKQKSVKWLSIFKVTITDMTVTCLINSFTGTYFHEKFRINNLMKSNIVPFGASLLSYLRLSQTVQRFGLRRSELVEYTLFDFHTCIRARPNQRGGL